MRERDKLPRRDKSTSQKIVYDNNTVTTNNSSSIENAVVAAAQLVEKLATTYSLFIHLVQPAKKYVWLYSNQDLLVVRQTAKSVGVNIRILY